MFVATISILSFLFILLVIEFILCCFFKERSYYVCYCSWKSNTFLLDNKNNLFYQVSEGIDFSDAKARGVIMVGIPYPSLKDPKVFIINNTKILFILVQIDLKKKYLDEKNKNGSLLSGKDWYVHQAIRTTNQAIGRVIRHKNDYGVIILCDKRFKIQIFIQ